MMNPPQMLATLMIWFCNFFMKQDKDHTWATVKKCIGNLEKFMDAVKRFDYDAVSGPTVKRIKNLELHSVEEYRAKSEACGCFAEILIEAKAYYEAKTAKAKALMKQLSHE